MQPEALYILKWGTTTYFLFHHLRDIVYVTVEMENDQSRGLLVELPNHVS